MDPTVDPTTEPSESPTREPTLTPTVKPTTVPTLKPSRMPTTMPTRKPTKMPTLIPTPQPTAPTVAPTAGPTRPTVVPTTARPSVSSEPTHLPTAPTESPTVAPSQGPTENPTTIEPTETPTAPPSAPPSVTPSKTPSVAPSRAPTEAPTLQPTHTPTLVPTRAPTIDPTPLWTAQLQSLLAGVPMPSAAHQSTYFELHVVSRTPSAVYGSCRGWTAWLSGELTTASYLYHPRSIALTLVTGNEAASSFNTVSAVCSESAGAASLLSLLNGRTTSGLTAGVGVSCSDHQWTVKTCGSSAIPALCVDCADPCTPAAMSVAPCGRQDCSASGIRLLSVSYGPLSAAPDITSVAVTPQRTALSVDVTLTSDATVSCGAFPAGSTVPANLQSLIALQNAAAASQSSAAVVSLGSLTPATAYTVYCYTQTPQGDTLSLAKTTAAAVNTTTVCCKTLTATLSTTSAPELRPSRSFLTITLSSKPSRAMQVTITGGTASLFSPSTFTVPGLTSGGGSDGPVVLRAALNAVAAGSYQFQVTSSSSEEFSTSYANTPQQSFGSLTLLAAQAAPLTPALVSAAFANDGASLSIAFDSATNRGGVGTWFKCSTLFIFECAASARCVWTDDATVTASLGACAQPSSSVRLAARACIKAKCVSSFCSGQSGWSNVTTPSGVDIQSTTSAVVPVVVLAGPSVIGPCDSLTIDASGSYQSGGRPFTSAAVTVSADVGVNVSAVQRYLQKSAFALSPPTVIPASLLADGVSYTLTVTLCNFLGKCSQAAKSVLVLAAPVPVVSLPGPALRYTTRSRPLFAYAAAFYVDCLGSSASTSSLTYSWSVSADGVPVLGLSSASKDPSKLLLPAYSLTPSTLYSMTLTVTVPGTSAASATASVAVLVQQGPLYASIAGGSSQSVRLNSSLSLDASSSRDSDIRGVSGTAAGLLMAWSCERLSPEYLADCSAVITLQPSGDSLVVFAPLHTPLESQFRVRVTVTDASWLRTASAEVLLSVSPVLAPVVIIGSLSAADGLINANQVLRVSAAVLMPVNTSAVVAWSVSDASLSLPAIASSATQLTVAAAARPTPVTVNLVIQANSLQPGTALTFSLTCTTAVIQQASVASVTVAVNAPPSPGVFAVSPPVGVSLLDTFAFEASLWTDDQLPMTYQFGYTAANGATALLTPLSTQAHTTSILPAGASVTGYAVQCVVLIVDSLLANATAFSSVVVSPDAPLSAQGIRDYQASLAFTSAADILMNGAFVSALLNQVNCSLAPDCAALHRSDCSLTTNTCGSCLPGYLGSTGDSNDPCLGPSESSAANKTCDGACSGRGRCSFVSSTTGLPWAGPCFVGSASCEAQCECGAGYSLSATCALSDGDMRIRQASRSALINATAALLDLQDPDAQSVQGWMGLLRQASLQPDELTADSAAQLLSVSQAVLTYALSLSFGVSDYQDLLAVIDTATKVTRRSSVLVGSLRRLEVSASAASPNSSLALSLSTLQQLGSAVSQDMVRGEQASVVVHSQFSLSAQVLSPSDDNDGPASVTLTVPSADSSQRQDVVSLALANSDRSEYRATLISMQAAAYHMDGLVSSPLTLHLSDSPCAVEGDCGIDLTLHYDATALGESPEPEEVEVTCTVGVVTAQNHTCSDGFVMNTSCNGTISGVLTSVCPHFSRAAVCASEPGSAVQSTASCTLQQYTETNVSCHCSYSLGSSSASAISTTGGSVSFGVLAVHTYHGVVQTWNIPAALERVIADVSSSRVLLTLIFVAVCFMVPASAAHYFDSRHQVHIEGETKLEQMLDDSITEAQRQKRKKHRSSGGGSSSRVGLVNIIGAERARARQSVLQAMSDRLFAITRTNRDIMMAEEYLPRITHATPLWERVKHELRTHHRWLSVWYNGKEHYPRHLRLLALASHVVTMMFGLCICFAYVQPDEGFCDGLTSEATCMQPRSTLLTHSTQCQWEGVSATSGACSYVEPGDQVIVLLWTALLCAVGTLALTIPNAWLIRHCLAAPLVDQYAGPPRVLVSRAAGGGAIRAGVYAAADEKVCGAHELSPQLQSEVEAEHLRDDILRHRSALTEPDRRDFDRWWGLRPTADAWRLFEDQCGVALDAKTARLLRCLIEAEQREVMLIDSTLRGDEQAVGRRLLFLLQADLLPVAGGRALRQKGDRDSNTNGCTTETKKALVWLYFLLLHASMLYYVCRFGRTPLARRQDAWFDAFMLWLAVDSALTSTASVLLAQVLLPLLVIGDMSKVKTRLMETIKRFQENILDYVTDQGGLRDLEADCVDFNAARYFSLSNRVARSYPSLWEAQIVALFSTTWPRTLLGDPCQPPPPSVGPTAFHFCMAAALSAYLSLDERARDALIELLVGGVGYGLLAAVVRLWNINTALAFAPLWIVFVIAALYTFCWPQKRDSRMAVIRAHAARIARSPMPPVRVAPAPHRSDVESAEAEIKSAARPPAPMSSSGVVERRQFRDQMSALLEDVSDEENLAGETDDSELNSGLPLHHPQQGVPHHGHGSIYSDVESLESSVMSQHVRIKPSAVLNTRRVALERIWEPQSSAEGGSSRNDSPSTLSVSTAAAEGRPVVVRFHGFAAQCVDPAGFDCKREAVDPEDAASRDNSRVRSNSDSPWGNK